MNRGVLGGMLSINFATLIAGGIAYAVGPETKGADDPLGWSTIFELAPVVLIGTLLFVKGRRLNLILLALLAADFVAMAVSDLF